MRHPGVWNAPVGRSAPNLMFAEVLDDVMANGSLPFDLPGQINASTLA